MKTTLHPLKKKLSTGAYEIVSRPLTIVLDYMN